MIRVTGKCNKRKDGRRKEDNQIMKYNDYIKYKRMIIERIYH